MKHICLLVGAVVLHFFGKGKRLPRNATVRSVGLLTIAFFGLAFLVAFIVSGAVQKEDQPIPFPATARPQDTASTVQQSPGKTVSSVYAPSRSRTVQAAYKHAPTNTPAAFTIQIETAHADAAPTNTPRLTHTPRPTVTPGPQRTAAPGAMVWVSRTGTKYHKIEDCANMIEPLYMTEEEAILKGREPCSNCVH